MRRLIPSPVDAISAREAYTDPGRQRHDGRPWLGVCMVASVDGGTVVDGLSAGLSSPADTEVLLTLRELADVIVVGASTVRHERYGPPKKPGQRIGVVTSRGAGIDFSMPLFASGAAFLITSDAAPDLPVDAVRAGGDTVDLPGALRQLDGTFIQAEGGARLNGSLLDAGLIDEVNLTISPQLVGGDSARLTVGAAAHGVAYRLAHVLEDAGFLFTRYVRRDLSVADGAAPAS